MNTQPALKVVEKAAPWPQQAQAALNLGDALPPLPTPRHEAWHYTNLRTIQTLPLEPDSIPVRAIAASVPVVTGPQYAFVNGIKRADLTLLEGLAPTLELDTHTPSLPHLDELDDWHNALPGEAVSIVASKGERTNLLHLMHSVAGHGVPVGGHVHVHVKAGASLTLAEHFCGVGGSARWLNPRLSVTVEEGGHFTHVVLQTLPPEAILTRREHLDIAANANYERFTLQQGAHLSRLESHMDAAQNTNTRLAGLTLTVGGQTHDTTLRLNHTHEAPQSHILQRNIVAGTGGDEGSGGHAVFQGKFYVAQKAQKTNAYMLCQSLLLHPKARVSTKPELEIYADDVKCSHGASTGSLRPEQLFYLAARGVPEGEARAMLTAAFAEELVGNVPSFAQQLVAGHVHHWLHNQAHGAPPPESAENPFDLTWLDELPSNPISQKPSIPTQ